MARPDTRRATWDAMVRRVRRANGTSIISHEILAPAAPEPIARLKADLGDDDTEIHVVYSARDLARQAPAGWQESVKQGRRWKYGRYLTKVREGRSWFARAFDLPTVLSTWGNGLPPERVHVVTVPHADAVEADPDLLWHRFCRAFGIEPDVGARGQRARQHLARPAPRRRCSAPSTSASAAAPATTRGTTR